MFFFVLFFNEDLLCCQGSSIPLDLVESCSTQRQRANKYKVYLQIILLCFELQNIVVVFQERKQQQPRTTMSPNLTKKTVKNLEEVQLWPIFDLTFFGPMKKSENWILFLPCQCNLVKIPKHGV